MPAPEAPPPYPKTVSSKGSSDTEDEKGQDDAKKGIDDPPTNEDDDFDALTKRFNNLRRDN